MQAWWALFWALFVSTSVLADRQNWDDTDFEIFDLVHLFMLIPRMTLSKKSEVPMKTFILPWELNVQLQQQTLSKLTEKLLSNIIPTRIQEKKPPCFLRSLRPFLRFSRMTMQKPNTMDIYKEDFLSGEDQAITTKNTSLACLRWPSLS